MWITILAILVFITFTIIANKQAFLALLAIPAILPSYLLRLKIFVLPTTILEIAILGIIFGIFVIFYLYNFSYCNHY